MTGRKPNLTGIQHFGAAAYVKLKNAGKLEKRASKARFVGYDNESKGYQIYWPEKHAVSIERNVVFNPGDSFEESVKIMNEEEQNKVLQNSTEKTSKIPVENLSNQNSNKNQNKNSLPEDPAPSDIPTALEHSIEESTPIVEPLCRSRLCDTLPEPELNTRRGFRARKVPGAYRRLNQGLDANAVFVDDLEDDLNEPGGADQRDLAENEYFDLPDSWALAGSMDEEPASLQEALEGPDGEEWKKGLEKEIGRLEAARTWRVVKAPEGAKVIPHSIVLRTKRGARNEVTECRVRIVAGGHRQRVGVDFDRDRMFYAVVKNPSQHAVLAHAAKKDWSIQHIDVKSAYLYAKLEGNAPTYMTPPVGYLKPEQKGMVLEILKCLYGLVQSRRGWYDELHGTFRKLGFTCSKIDHSVFICCLTTEKEDLVIAVATDDMAITGNSDQAVTRFKNEIKRVYEITDLGNLRWFLGMEIKRDRAVCTISINQSAYIEGMATKFGLTSAKPIYVPMLPGEVLSHDQSPSTPAEATEMSKIPYGNMIVTCCGRL